MIVIRLPIAAETGEALEAHFCEDYQEHWMLEENWQTGAQALRGYFETAEAARAALDHLRGQIAGLTAEPELEELRDEDWKEAYKLHFKAWSDRGLHFVPVWERESYPLPPGEEIVWLDPGMAFGTGNHETTRLCLRRLIDLAREDGLGGSVLDVGCGSGILAIAAAKLGFRPVRGFDLDPESVRIAIENAELCDVPDQVAFFWSDLREALRQARASVVLANILAPVLIETRELLLQSVEPGGALVLSGILARELADLRDVYVRDAEKQWGLPVSQNSRIDGEWAELCLRRPN